MPHDVQVVGDEDVGQPEVALQVREQVEDLRLHRHVERGHRLVADDHLRLQRQCAGDPDALPLAARELVRKAVVVLRVEADALQQALHPPPHLGRGPDAVHLERLADDRADRACAGSATRTGPERPSHLPPDRAHLARAGLRDVAAHELDGAAWSASSRMMQRARVDFPQPDSPTMPSVSPGCTSKETPSTAFTRPTSFLKMTPRWTGKCFVTSVTRGWARRPRPPAAPHRWPSRSRDHLRRPEPSPSRSLTSCGRWHALTCVTCPGVGASGGGGSSRQMSITYGQRGWKRQPRGGCSNDGGVPGMAVSGRRRRHGPAWSRGAPTCRGAGGARRSRPRCPARPRGRRTSRARRRRSRRPRRGRA